MVYDCPECGKPLRKKTHKSRYFCENSTCSVVFVRHPDNQSMMEIVYRAGARGMRRVMESSRQYSNQYLQVPSRIPLACAQDSQTTMVELKEACGYRGAGQTPICRLHRTVCETVYPFNACRDYLPRSQLETREGAMMVSDFGNGSGTVPELSESPIELVFSRDCLIIRSPVVVPLKGRSLHEERVGYNEIPSGCLNMQVKSIEKQEENDQLKALVFKVNRFEQASEEQKTDKEKQTSASVLVISQGCIEYSYLNVSICRSIFPGYRVPFVLVTDQGNISAYVGNAQKDTRIGAPLIGSTMLGLKQWYSAHPEIEVGDTVLIETIEPKKRYRLSLLGHTDQSEPPFAEEIHSDTSSLPTTLVLRKKKA